MSTDPKRKSLGGNRGFDSWKNLKTTILQPLTFSSENGARAEVFRLAFAAPSPTELDEWAGGLGIAEAIRQKALS